MNAKPTKLKNGTWGVTTEGVPEPGDVVTVETRKGKTWETVIDRVLWSGNGKAICSTRRTDEPEADEHAEHEHERLGEATTAVLRFWVNAEIERGNDPAEQLAAFYAEHGCRACRRAA